MKVLLQEAINPIFFRYLQKLYEPLLSNRHLKDRFQYTIFAEECPFPVGIASINTGSNTFVQFALIPEMRGNGVGHAVLDELVRITKQTRVNWGCKRFNYPSLKVLQERKGGLFEGSVSIQNGKSYEGFFRVSGEATPKMQSALAQILPQSKERYLDWLRNEYTPRNHERYLLKRYLFTFIRAIDSHFHIHPENDLPPTEPVISMPSYFIPPDDLLHKMDQNAVNRAIIFGIPSIERNTTYVNSSILEYCSHPSGRFVPFAILDDNMDVARAIAEGFRGFKEHVYGQRILRNRNGKPGLASSKRKRLYAEIANQRLPLVTHMGPNVVSRVKDILRSAPTLRLILAHLGASCNGPITGDEVRETLHVLSSYPNVYFDVSAVFDPTVVEEALTIIGNTRLVWGSDWPFEQQSQSIDRILSSERIDIFTAYAMFRSNIEALLAETPRNSDTNRFIHHE